MTVSFLYFEDDLSSRQIMEVLLKDIMGFTDLTMYEDSKDFEARLNQLTRVPDIIFLDVHIKPNDGYAMLKIIRSQARFNNAKVVALTASVMSNEVEYLRQAGFDSLVAKPVNPVSFPNLINAILSGETVWNITWD